MNQKQIGILIAKLRKDAGFTQRSLAESLFVTDKAVSKWERGISSPDSSLLPKLSMLLNADIEFLISGSVDYLDHNWSGFISANDLGEIIYDKPVIDYLISYFMLVGIKNIYINTNDTDVVLNRHLEQYGVIIHFQDRPRVGKVMIVNDKRLIFGPNLTRLFCSFMILNKTVIPSIDGISLPIIFSHKFNNIDDYYKDAIFKPLGRGMINIPLNEEAARFVEIYQKHHCKISDLGEIARNRGFLKCKPKVEFDK